MSKLTEILKFENAPREEPRQKRTVRLVKMGAFLRAYDWSAWLLKRYGSPQECVRFIRQVQSELLELL